MEQQQRQQQQRVVDATSTAIIRIDTMDRFSQEHCTVGYALVALFMDTSGNQPTKPSMDGVFLREGNYQLPLYQTPPPDMRKLTSRSLEKAPRVPCASVLVRVKPAPKSPAGKTLGRADVPEQDWQRFGLAQPMPEFAPGVYDNSELSLTDSERKVLQLRAREKDEDKVFGAARSMMFDTQNNAPEEHVEGFGDSEKTFEEWAISMMAKTPTKMIDFQRAEKFRPEQGFSITVAGLTNMKPPGLLKPSRLYKVIYSLLKPGIFYQRGLPTSEQADFTRTYDLRSPQTAPRFLDPPRVFEDQKMCSAQCVVLDVRFLKVDVSEGAAVPEEPRLAPDSGAWGLLPVFPASDFSPGSFVVPLFLGPFPADVLNTEDPMETMVENAVTRRKKNSSFRLLEGSSVVVQICNALLPNVVKPAFQDPELNFIHVKRLAAAIGIPKRKYVFHNVADGGQKSVNRLVPKPLKSINGRRKYIFLDSANERFAEATGMTDVVSRGGVERRQSS